MFGGPLRIARGYALSLDMDAANKNMRAQLYELL